MLLCCVVYVLFCFCMELFFFFFNDTATTEIYTLSLHDALRSRYLQVRLTQFASRPARRSPVVNNSPQVPRSEEHTSELQSRLHLVCRLLLEKKNHLSLHLITSTKKKTIQATH